MATMSDEEKAEKGGLASDYIKSAQKKAVRDLILNEGLRLDGRKTTVRPIWTKWITSPVIHGSSIFTRGETQSLTTLTLGTKLDEQLIDGALVRKNEKFLLHYNFRRSPQEKSAPCVAPAAVRWDTATSLVH